jgi:hexosaminidase
MTALAWPALAVIPAPHTLEPAPGEFRLRPDTPLVLQDGHDQLAGALDLLAGHLAAGAGWDLPRQRAATPPAGAVFLGGLGDEDLAGDEAYRVDVTPAGVVLRARTPAGAVWAVQTLRQLLPPQLETRRPQPVADPGRPDGRFRPLPPGHRYPRNGLAPIARVPAPPPPEPWSPPAAGIPVAAVHVADAPRFGWRGVLLDSGRHFVDVPTIERLIDLMALHKLNILHWHLTEDQGWRLEIRAYPRLTEVGAWRTEPDGTRYGGFYTQDEARHVVAYAARRGITVVPEIEMPGHSQAALAAHPELSCRQEPLVVQNTWGVWPDIYCAGNDEVFTFLQTVLDEVLEIFPSRFIHVGGDEAPRDRWRECPRCRERVAAEGLPGIDALQSWFLARISRWLDARGRRLVGWDEILDGGLAPGATVQSWQGFEGAVAAARHGHDTIVSPTSHAYLDYDVGVTDLATAYAFEPVPPQLSADEAAHVLGGAMNMWTEYAPQGVLDERLFPRLCALSEALWSAPERRGFDDFFARLRPLRDRLPRIGVRVGPEARPLALTPVWNPAREAWHLTWRSRGTLPAGDRAVELEIDGIVAAHPDSGEAFVSPPGDEVFGQLTIAGEPYGAPVHWILAADLGLGQPHLAVPDPAGRYLATVARPVTGGVRPDGDYRDGTWLAWEGHDATLTIDLGEIRDVRRLTAVCLHAGGRLIHAPEVVEMATSADGEHWTAAGQAETPLSPRVMARVLVDYVVELPEVRDVRWVRFTLPQRADAPRWPWSRPYPPWIFLGQVLIER